MDYLIDFAEKDEEFSAILESASKFASTQGVVLDLDSFWLTSWLIGQRMGQAYLAAWVNSMGPFFISPAIVHPGWGPARPLPKRPQIYNRPIDRDDIEKWKPPHWDDYRKWIGLPENGPPLIVRVCLRPKQSVEEDTPTVEGLRQDGGRLQIELETRIQAVLCANPRRIHRPLPGGVSIGVSATDFGTLCVTLKKDNGEQYALTCSHVVGQGDDVYQAAKRDTKKATVIGKSVDATTLASCSSTDPCNPWSGTSYNEEDLSLIKIDSSVASAILEVLDIGPLNGVVSRAALSTGQAVDVMGRTTRYSILEIGGLAAWYRFERNGKYYCFKNLFEVQSPYGATRSIREGDSGAPVCTASGSGTGWCGMIVGCDTFKGYAMYSESIEAWYKGKNYQLHIC